MLYLLFTIALYLGTIVGTIYSWGQYGTGRLGHWPEIIHPPNNEATVQTFSVSLQCHCSTCTLCRSPQNHSYFTDKKEMIWWEITDHACGISIFSDNLFANGKFKKKKHKTSNSLTKFLAPGVLKWAPSSSLCLHQNKDVKNNMKWKDIPNNTWHVFSIQ